MHVCFKKKMFWDIGEKKTGHFILPCLLRNIDLSSIYNKRGKLQCGSLVMEVWHGKKGQREASHTCRLRVGTYHNYSCSQEPPNKILWEVGETKAKDQRSMRCSAGR